MTISLVIPAYNEGKYLGECLACAVKQQASLAEIIVVNNASTDETALIAHRFPGVRVIDEPVKGLTHARERGRREARGDIIAYIDADTHMPPGWVETVEAAFTADPRVVCVSGPYRYYDASRFSRLLGWLYWRVVAWPAYRLSGYMVVGGNFAAKKKALAAVGGFDTTIVFYGEDTNVARRLARVGQVKFMMGLTIDSSMRRLKKEGVLRTALRYALNFLSEVFLHRPVTTNYTDIR